MEFNFRVHVDPPAGWRVGYAAPDYEADYQKDDLKLGPTAEDQVEDYWEPVDMVFGKASDWTCSQCGQTVRLRERMEKCPLSQCPHCKWDDTDQLLFAPNGYIPRHRKAVWHDDQ